MASLLALSALLAFAPLQAAASRDLPAAEILPWEGGYAVKTSARLLVWRRGFDFELYDPKADPGRVRNLVETEPIEACALAKILIDRLHRASSKAAPELNLKDVEESLRRIGYTR